MPDNQPLKTEAIATEQKHSFKMLLPDFTPKWSREWVIPDNVLLPDDAKAEMQVDSTYPVNRPQADITVLQEWDSDTVPEVPLPPLKLKDKKVVKADDTRPAHKFTLKNEIWDEYDKLKYHFECQIDQTKKKTTKLLLVKRWHVQAVDNSDNNAANPNNIYQRFRLTERANFLNSFSGSADDKAEAWTFHAGNTTFAQFGEKMKNAYTFVYTGHGAVMCRTCHAMFNCLSGGGVSDADFGKWTICSTANCGGSPRSTHCIGGWQVAGTPSFMDGTHIANEATCPTTPRYLAFSVCCGGAFETSLYDAYIGRGTKYCVGFKKSTRCDWARDYAKSFFDTWAKTHKCNPAKIPDVFDGLQSTWETKLQPDLFGRVGGLGSRLRNLGRSIADLF